MTHVRIYSPVPALRHPAQLFREMWGDLKASRELAWRLFVRDFSAMYRQSLLGYLWAFLPPLAASFTFIFLQSQGVVSSGETPIPYAAYVMIGTLLWQVFADALNAPLRTMTTGKLMLIKLNFPREGLLLSGLYMTAANFLVRFILLAGVFIWFGMVPPVTALLLPVGLAAIIGLGFIIGLLLTPLGLLYKDVQNAIPIIMPLWMLLTPVVYALPAEGPMAQMIRWNPIAPALALTRDWITIGTSIHLPGFILVFALTIMAGIVGWIAFRIALPHLIARLGM